MPLGVLCIVLLAAATTSIRADEVPGRTGTGTVTLRMHYHPDITGVFVAHCHILTHEDIGMMQELRIRKPPGPIR